MGPPRIGLHMIAERLESATPSRPACYNAVTAMARTTSAVKLMTSRPDRLVDSWGRHHNNLRISVTDRCNIRCVYCMPAQVQFLPRSELLSFEEIERFVRIAVTLGIDKVRLTGGEPLVRRNLPTLVERLARAPRIAERCSSVQS